MKAVDGAYEVHDGTGAVVGGHAWGSPTSHLFATYVDDGARAVVPEGGATYNRGDLEFNLTGCPSGCAIRLIVQLPFEEYLLGIGEVPSSWPMEALRAQAVAARSFALYKIRAYGVQASCNCNVYDGSNDQVYIGWNKEGGTDGARWVKAVDDDGGPDRRLSRAGGVDGIHRLRRRTHRGPERAVGNPALVLPLPRRCLRSGREHGREPVDRLEPAILCERVHDRARALHGLDRRRARVRCDRSRGLRADRERGGARRRWRRHVTGAELRSALSLPDDRVWINSDKNVLGDIRTKYDALMCEPGLPTSTTMVLPGGSRQRFQSGAIYRNSAVDATVWLKGRRLRRIPRGRGRDRDGWDCPSATRWPSGRRAT